jgi:hypothetical protein
LAIRNDGLDLLIVNEGLEEDGGAVVVEEEGVVELGVVLPQVLTLKAHLLFINRTITFLRFLNMEKTSF